MTGHPPRSDEQAATAVVLAINPGSSSLKAVLRDPAPALTVGIERLGTDQACWTATAAGQAPASGPFLGDLPAAITHLAELLTRRGVRPDAVAHRVGHGGPSFNRSTDTVREVLAGLVAWAPLHLPGDLASIDAARATWPDAVHVACFDTAFHHTLPDEARRLPLPAQADRLGLRHYGFHGLSVQSIVDAVPDLGGATITHLGSVAMAIAAAATALPRWDTLVFTGGIGEHAPAVYGEICHRLTSLRPPPHASGISTTNTTAGAAAGVRELTATGVAVLIVPADEAAVMDREARALLTTSAAGARARPGPRRRLHPAT